MVADIHVDTMSLLSMLCSNSIILRQHRSTLLMVSMAGYGYSLAE